MKASACKTCLGCMPARERATFATITMSALHRWIRLFGAAVVLSSASVLATSSMTSLGCNPAWVSDGLCDVINNTPECGYDGGDCCSCTCTISEDEDYYSCGYFGFACVDPEAPCVDDDDVTVELQNSCGELTPYIGNGQCLPDANTPQCDYDGGDCCSCTCVDNELECGSLGFQCIDPAAECVDDDSFTVDFVENCSLEFLGNGFCDDENNNALCGYDGGDCCECTCILPDETSGFGDFAGCDAGFACIDPEAPCVNDDDITVDNVEDCPFTVTIGDGFCQVELNTPACHYDGGDCCSCTCNPDDAWVAEGYVMPCADGDFACIDPEATCSGDDDVTIGIFENCAFPEFRRDQFCDTDNNVPECDYDGGDCCESTCVTLRDDDTTDARFGECVQFDCRDPNAPDFGYTDFNNDDGEDDESASTTSTEPTDLVSQDDDDLVFSYEFVPWEQEGPLPTVDGAVEVGTKTEVGVMATACDVRPGRSSNQVGCGEVGGGGCAAVNTRDGIASEIESRWSCATKIVDGEGPCRIEYMFAEPQDVVDVQVAFWKGNERIRTLEVHLDGVLTNTHESYAGSTFNTLGVSASGVSAVMLESVDLLPDEWISLIEVLIFVTP
ncbi:unnamed protein product [Ectocarpus sp. 6 AP-2014]